MRFMIVRIFSKRGNFIFGTMTLLSISFLLPAVSVSQEIAMPNSVATIDDGSTVKDVETTSVNHFAEVVDWDLQALNLQIDSSAGDNWEDSALCESLPDLCDFQAPEGGDATVASRGSGKVSEKACGIFGGDYDKLAKAVRTLEILVNDFPNLDVASLPNLPWDKIVSAGDFEARKAYCKSHLEVCGVQLLDALNFWSEASNFLMLETSSLGGPADGFASAGDFLTLLTRLRVLLKFCDPAGIGPEAGTDRCCLCTYDGNDEAMCAADRFCRRTECHTGADNKCHASGYVQCASLIERNRECKHKLVTTYQERDSINYVLPDDFKSCRSILDYHFGHSSPVFIPERFPVRFQACVTGAPWCTDYRHINLGCNTFSSNEGSSSVDQAREYIERLAGEYGLENIKIMCTGNQDYAVTTMFSPEFQKCTQAHITIDCQAGNRIGRTDLPRCRDHINESCVGRNKVMLCTNNGQRSTLTCTGNFFGGPTWQNMRPAP